MPLELQVVKPEIPDLSSNSWSQHQGKPPTSPGNPSPSQIPPQKTGKPLWAVWELTVVNIVWAFLP